MQTLQDYVVIQVDEYEKKKGELYQAEQWKTLPPTGTVTSVGPKVTDIKVGDRVHFLRFAAIDGLDEKERICRERDIVGIL